MAHFVRLIEFFNSLARSAAPAMLSPIVTMLSLVQYDCFSSTLISALSLCQDCSALRGSGSSRQSEGLLADR